MDTAALGEWSRYVVAGAIATYVVAWLAYSAEAVQRLRARGQESLRSDQAEGAQAPALVTVGGVSPDGVPDPGPRLGDAGASADNVGPGDRMNNVGFSVAVLATLLLGLGVVMRAVGVGRVPWGNMHEFSITGALVASVVFVAVARTKVGRAIAVWLILALFVTLVFAITVLYVAPGPLVPALRSYWLVIHVGCAVLAFGLFMVSTVVSGLQIAAERAERRGATQGFGAALPSSDTLDRLSYGMIAVAFPIWTVGPLILGAIWAEVSWGRYWGWDPKEVWALITWLTYAAYLHARATAGWKGSKASVVALVGFATVLFSYFGVNIFLNGLHSYGGL